MISHFEKIEMNFCQEKKIVTLFIELVVQVNFVSYSGHNYCILE